MVEVADHLAADEKGGEVLSALLCSLIFSRITLHSRSLFRLTRQVLEHGLLMILCRIAAIVARMMAALSGEDFAKVLKHLRSSTVVLVHAVLNDTTQV